MKAIKKSFKKLQEFILPFSGNVKPRMCFSMLYSLFPDFQFIPTGNYGSYVNFGEAYEQKVFDMQIIAPTGEKTFLVYREYTDQPENLAYFS